MKPGDQLILSPITRRAKNKLRQAGTDLWVINFISDNIIDVSPKNRDEDTGLWFHLLRKDDPDFKFMLAESIYNET